MSGSLAVAFWRHARPSIWLGGVILAALLPTTLSASIYRASDMASLTSAAAATPGNPVLASDGLYIPTTIDTSHPVSVLVAFHGFSGSGPAIASRLRACADQYGWVILAPTMAYRDYFDPQQLRADAQQNLPRVRELIQQLRDALNNMQLQPKLLLYGFSRGAQMAHRFSMVYPSEVVAVAVLSAGSYTLPEAEDAANQPLSFPFGVSDLPVLPTGKFDQATFVQIPFWVGVGAEDTNPSDTSRAWDIYEGQTRVDRAQAFASVLQGLGVSVELQVFGGAGHEETDSMRLNACAFLAARTI